MYLRVCLLTFKQYYRTQMYWQTKMHKPMDDLDKADRHRSAHFCTWRGPVWVAIDSREVSQKHVTVITGGRHHRVGNGVSSVHQMGFIPTHWSDLNKFNALFHIRQDINALADPGGRVRPPPWRPRTYDVLMPKRLIFLIFFPCSLRSRFL